MSRTTAATTIFASADPTASYTYSTTCDMFEYTYLTLWFQASGLAPTSFEMIVEASPDGSTQWSMVPKADGEEPAVQGPYALQDDDGTVLDDDTCVVRLAIGAERYIRIGVKRTGGDGTTRLVCTAVRSN